MATFDRKLPMYIFGTSLYYIVEVRLKVIYICGCSIIVRFCDSFSITEYVRKVISCEVKIARQAEDFIFTPKCYGITMSARKT